MDVLRALNRRVAAVVFEKSFFYSKKSLEDKNIYYFNLPEDIKLEKYDRVLVHAGKSLEVAVFMGYSRDETSIYKATKDLLCKLDFNDIGVGK